VESCWVLDVNDLAKRGCLQPGLFSTYKWHDGVGGIFSISQHYEAESGVGRLYLSWRSHIVAGNGEQGEVVEIVPIVHEPCRFGGTQPYFLCPGIGGGVGVGGAVAATAVGCGQRVSKLFLAHRYFLCRSCSQLVYASKYERPWQRASRRASKLRQRLGITGLGVADKPKGMWVPDYERLLEAALQAEIQETEAGTNRILQIAAKIERQSRRNFTL
jgi:hypothetical protein